MNYDIPKSVKTSLKIALKNNELIYYLFCTNFYKYNFKINVPNIGPTIDYRMLLFSIYDKYKEDPSIYNTFVQTLDYAATNVKHGDFINILLNILSWQLTLEKQGYAPFKVDVQPILNKLRNNIAESKEIFTKQKPGSANSYVDDFKEIEPEFEKHGCKLF